MKRTPFLIALAIFAVAMLASAAAMAQSSPPRFPPGGFDRPLSSSALRGNPGGSPKLTIAEFKSLLARWADYDANKNRRLDKNEAPELFAALFDQSDVNHDGALDDKERAGVTGLLPAPSQPAAPKKVPTSGPVRDPLGVLLFGDPLFGSPPIPQAAR